MQKLHLTLACALVLATSVCQGQVIDPLHGCIIGDPTCFDNGTVTPTSTNPLPNFTFTISPGPQTGDMLVEILIPDDVAGAASKNFTISATDAGTNNTSTIAPVTATLKGDWTTSSEGLYTFLGITLDNGSPDNKLSAWLPYTQAHGDSGAGGYEVYQVDLGQNKLQSPSNPTEPVLTLGGTSTLPIASVLTGFLSDGTNYISTANSGGIFEAGPNGGPAVPEPASIILLGTVSLFVLSRARKALNRR